MVFSLLLSSSLEGSSWGNSMATVDQGVLARPRRWKMSRSVLEEHLTALFCISPWLIGFLGFEIGPILAEPHEVQHNQTGQVYRPEQLP